MNIYICNTAYQMIVSIQMALTICKDEKAVIVLTDVIKNAERIANSLDKYRCFEKVVFVKTKDLEWKEGDFLLPRKKRVYITFIKKVIGNDVIDKLINTSNKVYVANLSGFPIVMAKYVQSISREFEFNIYEDGLSSYSQIYKNGVDYRLHNRNLLKKIQYSLFPSIIASTSKYYLFYPELLVWNPPFEIKKIPLIRKNNYQLVSILNDAFDYAKLVDSYKENILFFEESYIEDGIPVDDVRIVKSLVNIFGPDNVFIKRHPRVRGNRFENLGVKYNKDTSVPWEVILINKDLSSKLLVTMTSTAVVNSLLLVDSDTIASFEYNVLENSTSHRIRFSIEVIKKLEQLFPARIRRIDDFRTTEK